MAWLAGWPFRKAVTYTHSGSLTNYQVKILVGESSGATGEQVDCGGLCNSDFSDIRFTTSDGSTLLDHWHESTSGTTPNQLATFWVELPTIDSSGYKLFMYYGNIDAATTSDGEATFPFFEDWSGDKSKWTGDTDYLTISSGTGTVSHGSGDREIHSTFTSTGDVAIRTRANITDADNGQIGWSDDPTNDDYILIFHSSSRANHSAHATGKAGVGFGDYSTVALGFGSFHIYDISWFTSGTDTARDWIDGVESDTGTTSNVPTNTMSIMIRAVTAGVVASDWILARKYNEEEPTQGTWGSREVDNWLTGWTYRKEITVTGTATGTDYQVYVAVGESAGATGEEVDCGTNCNTDFSDLRFTDEKGDVLSYWIENISGTTPNQLCEVYFKAPVVSTTGTTYYMYYGNSGASSLSSGSDTFIAFDDFERGSDGDEVGGNWTEAEGTCSISTTQAKDGTRSAKFVGDGTNYPRLKHAVTASNTISVKAWYYKQSGYSSWMSLGDGTNVMSISFNLDNNILAYDGATWVDTTLNWTAATWQSVEIFDFDWVGLTASMRIDSTTKTAIDISYALTGALYDNWYLHTGANNNGVTNYIDKFFVRQRWATEPTKAFAAEEGWLTGWDYRNECTFTHASSLTDYQVKVLVGESSGASGEDTDCGAWCNTDFSDIRFTGPDGSTLLDYWIESTSGTTPNQLATIWVELPTIDSGGYKVYMYYGNASAADAASGDDTFLLYDHFTGTSVDAAKWNSAGTPTVASSELVCDAASDADRVSSVGTYSSAAVSMRTRLKANSDGARWGFQETVANMINSDDTGKHCGCQWGWGNLYTNFKNTSAEQTAVEALANGTYYVFDVDWVAGTKSEVWREGTSKRSTTDSNYVANSVDMFAKLAGYATVDWVAIRKKNTTEPTQGTWEVQYLSQSSGTVSPQVMSYMLMQFAN